ncbi:hypothetical protein BMW24_003475 [Mycobacterium heckeshornense]|uniref:hypothetical protein n=1 Tax=Mycobacterium heckeshornense TaxID=110505 RepID=UPI0008FD2817|nr:hypothetical protein [Mycobacterium heckeshornense]PIJ36737.1 hypothetical protein BMW24_003190 [Mycobacterium heckeshornense]PIJ36788.1 hypothetical protein BMW24_003475 [Mycobacterium heckeshornense]
MNIEDEIAAGLASAEVQAALDELAREVCDQVKALTPVFGDRPPHRAAPAEGEIGDARNAVHVEPLPDGGRRVISRDKKAVWIEIGTRHMPEYAPFTKAAAMFGAEGGPSFSASGRDSMSDEGVAHAHAHLRGELERFAKLSAEGAAAHEIAAAARSVQQARIARSAAFKAARGRRGR